MSHRSDDELAQAIFNGDECAAKALINRYNSYVYQTLRAKVENFEAAKDLTQEVWTKVCKGLHSYTPQGKFKPWLNTVIKSVHIDWGRKEERTPQPVAHDDQQDVFKDIIDLGQVSPLEALIRTEGHKLVWQALDSMPNNLNKTVCIMHDLEGYPLTEIAEALDITVGSTRMRAFRGRLAFQKAFCRIAPDYFI